MDHVHIGADVIAIDYVGEEPGDGLTELGAQMLKLLPAGHKAIILLAGPEEADGESRHAMTCEGYDEPLALHTEMVDNANVLAALIIDGLPADGEPCL